MTSLYFIQDRDTPTFKSTLTDTTRNGQKPSKIV